jgi:uncharacterized damage-inducible protein DinB
MSQRLIPFVSLVALVFVMSVAGPSHAQGTDATTASVKVTYDLVKGHITKAAAQVPEDKYPYQPSKDVRTLGQLFGHIANSSAMICGMAIGSPAANAGDAEKLPNKAAIQKAVAGAFAVCDKAIASITAANANEAVDLFGMKHTRVGALAFNAAHLFEHYGNIVTYMRMNGMVPPSSAN